MPLTSVEGKSSRGLVMIASSMPGEKIGGGETVRKSLTQELVTRGYGVKWYTPTGDGSQIVENQALGNNRLAGRFPSTAGVTAFRNDIDRQKPVAVVMNGFSDWCLALTMASLGSGTPIVQIFHGDPDPRRFPTDRLLSGAREVDMIRRDIGRSPKVVLKELLRPLLAPLRNRVIRSVYSNREVRSIAVSYFVSRRIGEVYRIPENRVQVAYPPSTNDQCNRRATLESPGEVRVSYVGRISPEKGLRRFVDLAQGCRGLPVKFSVVGPDDGPFGQVLRQEARKTVEFKGPFQGERLCSEYLATNVLAALSPNEGHPLVVVEALRHGVPVLARRIPAIEEIFGHFATYPGALIRYDGQNGLADAVKYLEGLVKNPESWREQSRSALMARTVFDPDIMARNFVDSILRN